MAIMINEAQGLNKELLCVVQNLNGLSKSQITIRISPKSSISNLHSEISKLTHCTKGSFLLYLMDHEDKSEILMEENSEQELSEVLRQHGQKYMFKMTSKDGSSNVLSNTIDENKTAMFPNTFNSNKTDCSSVKPGVSFKRRAAISSESFDPSSISGIDQKNNQNLLNSKNNNDDVVIVQPYRGLVNQAMTCYLNSLIQTLYMTPEFRNALYKWKFDYTEDENLSIPYQLQHLFLLLQTSNRDSVETTGLTRSFGWDSSEAWQQHDIQELCRVMFEALEAKFEGTNQADLIKGLYEGSMKDYVQCCECSYESARDDTFLDIPITIRPFASNTSYKSVIEGLNAFVEPETLADTNQYFCEKCSKKCDAKKGLKFTKFPYLLTLQLKRFDFDYLTMRRIKLQDRMHFPLLLDLNSFVENEDADDSTSDKESLCPSNISKEATEYRLSPTPCDEEEDLSSHDSGQDYEQSSTIIPPSTADDVTPTATLQTCENAPKTTINLLSGGNNSEEDVSSVDEGIDVGACSSTSSHSTHKNFHQIKRQTQCSPASWNTESDSPPDGPYIYELFSIMVHSGSAAGGHYYAYIKSFENGLWYSFNDQNVIQVSQNEIEKSFGGVMSSRITHSSFSSSTNAYMLMYRQVNRSLNAEFLQPDMFPSHIKQMIELEKEKEQQRLKKLEYAKFMCTARLFLQDPITMVIAQQEEFEFHRDTKLEAAIKSAYLCLKLDEAVTPLHNCRLVKYDYSNEVIERSFDLDTDDRDTPLIELLGGHRHTYSIDLLLETKTDDKVFKRYLPNGVTANIQIADPNKLSLSRMFVERFEETQTVHDVKEFLAEKLNCSTYDIILVMERLGNSFKLLKNPETMLKNEGMYRRAKLFADVMSGTEKRQDSNPFHELCLENTRLFTILDRICNILYVRILLPPDFETSTSSTTSDSFEQDSNNNHLSTLTSDSTQISSDVTNAQSSVNFNSWSSYWNKDIPEDLEMDTGLDHNRRQRTNSCEDDDVTKISITSSSRDFPIELQRKLLDYKNISSFDDSAMFMRVSPTSSVQCEGGDSNDSDAGSVLQEVDFQESTETDSSVFTGNTYNSTYMDEPDSSSVLEAIGLTANREFASSCLHSNEYQSSQYLNPFQSNLPDDNFPTSQEFERIEKESVEEQGPADHFSRSTTKSDSYNKALQYADFGSEPMESFPSHQNQTDGSGDASPLKSISHHSRESQAIEKGDCVAEKTRFSDSSEVFKKISSRRRNLSQTSVVSDTWGVSHDLLRQQFYFNVTAMQKRSENHLGTVLQVEMDKRMPVITFRRYISRLVNKPTNTVCIFKLTNKIETELTTIINDFQDIQDGQEYLIKFGRVLKIDEFRCKLYLLDLNDPKPNSFLMESVVAQGMTVAEAKKEFCKELAANKIIFIQPDRLRLRKRVLSFRCPRQIYMDTERFGSDIFLDAFLEFYLQILPGPEPKVSQNFQVILYRRWRPSQLAFDNFAEIVLDTKQGDQRAMCMDTVSQEICALTDIPWDSFEITLVDNKTFPFIMNPLDVDRELEWIHPSTTSSSELFSDGMAVFIKDRREEMKEISESERADLIRSDSDIFSLKPSVYTCNEEEAGSSASSRPASYRREKALKIYTVDTQPKKNARLG